VDEDEVAGGEERGGAEVQEGGEGFGVEGVFHEPAGGFGAEVEQGEEGDCWEERGTWEGE